MASILDSMDPLAEPSALELTDPAICLSSPGPHPGVETFPEPAATYGKQKLPEFNNGTA
jgi:hypothetical protein